MVVGEYSIFWAIRRMETLSYPSLANDWRAAARISWRRASFSRCPRSATLILNADRTLYALKRCQAISALSPQAKKKASSGESVGEFSGVIC
jgi:hypothetical protein